MDFSLTPGKEIKTIGKLKEILEPTISIITPFYNGGATLQTTYNSVLSQTYPFYEWIIVDDGSTDKKSLDLLKKLASTDERIKLFHKENAGPAQARDYGVNKSSAKTKYIFFLDCDDIMANTMLECLYWTLETHPEGSFAYTSMINFGAKEYYWERKFSVKEQKESNLICISSMVRKNDFKEVGGFGIKEKAMYEDWNLWLKLLAAGKKPICLNAPVFWYRTSNTGEFSRAKQNHDAAMKIVMETSKKINKNIKAIQFPHYVNNDKRPENYELVLPQYQKENSKTILFLLPWTVMGGADIFSLELIKRLTKNNYNCIVTTTLPMTNTLRQQVEQYTSEFYDLTTFLEVGDYPQFIKYLTKSRNIDIIFVCNTVLGYALANEAKKEKEDVAIIDYIHSIDLYDCRGGFGKYSEEFDDIIDATFTCNNFTTNQLIKNYGKPNAKTIYIGTDCKRYDPKKYDVNNLKQKYKIPKEKKIITFIARLSFEKRPLLFIRIAKILLEERKDLLFLIAGDGPMASEVATEIKKSNLSQDVKILGMVKESEEIYAISDITINCSLLEGLALTSYESLSMAVPVISADVGGQAELIDETVGEIIPFLNSTTDEEIEKEAKLYADAVNKILVNLNYYKKNARERIVKKYNYDNMADEFVQVFQKISPSEKKTNKPKDLFKYYQDKMTSYYNGLVKEYCEKNLKIYEGTTYWKIKHEFLQIGIRYDVRKEMKFVFTTMRNLYHAFKDIVASIMNFILFIVKIIPAIFISIKVIITILIQRHKNLKKDKKD